MSRFRSGHEALLAVLLLALLIGARVADPSFVTWRTQAELSGLVWETALIAIPMTLVMLTGGIDLSVGAAMSLASVGFGLTFERTGSPWAGLAVGVVTGALCGWANGLFVAKAKIAPLIVTLATMSAFYGLAEGLSHARPISGFPGSYASAMGGALPSLLFLAALVAAAAVLALTPGGQVLFAIGHNETATRMSGVKVDRVKTCAYVLTGLAAGTAAVLYAARRNTVKADIGQGMELDVITAVVLGGTSVFGGRGSVVGTTLGVLLVHETRQFVSWHWERDELNLIVIAALLVVATAAASLRNRNRSIG
ncbi:MAG: ABC transporter permease [Armatimonadetes bacterium]|nr:ABC transporter permease [Armatimonadota bacterium]